VRTSRDSGHTWSAPIVYSKATQANEANFRTRKAGQPEKHNDLLPAEIDRLSGEVEAIVLAHSRRVPLNPHAGIARSRR